MHDIQTSEDVKLLVDTFYSAARSDEDLGYIFNDIAQVDWPKHLPRMYAFWEFMLLDADTFRGNPIEPHRHLAQKVKLTEAHFDRWVALFQASVDCNFQGANAEKAKFRAMAIAESWKPKFSGPFSSF